MRPLLFDLGAHPGLSVRLQDLLGAERGALELRRFPDGESYLRLDTSPQGRAVILLCPLDRPDECTLPMLFAAATCRELGATCVGLAAPYLAYMRQDIRFRPGEAVTSRTYAGMLSGALDWLVTVDPHLHRYQSLDEIYRIPSRSVAAAPALAEWLRAEVACPVLIGPDAESAQWVAEVAARIDAPWRVLEKTRSGDREVAVSVPDLDAHAGCTPVLLDDIVSTGGTMAAALAHLREQGFASPVCLLVHAIFAAEAEAMLRAAGATRIVSCNTVVHSSNSVCVAEVMADGIRGCLD
ncbi:MAG: ribose-phosphate pyrophosphokinase [Gammaproteobacteria bacterium]|nr:MAG: ribose-phosphate pyrophosphokinase [Gammaproteobacteria bacterium]